MDDQGKSALSVKPERHSAYASANRIYLPAVDHIRAAAALLVLFYHGFQVFSGHHVFDGRRAEGDWTFTQNPLTAVLIEGHSGVALFMVLSGFILTYGALGREVRYFAFMRNRFLRIYPLLVLLLVFGVYVYRQNFSFLGFLQTLLFGANLPGSLSLGAIAGMFWTIAVEFQFYLVFPFLLAFMNRGGVKPLLLIIAVALMLRTFALTTGTHIRDLSYWTIVGRIDQFLIGMLLAKMLDDNPKRADWLGRLFPVAMIGVVAALFAFNQMGGWVSAAWWKAYWPTVEGLIWAFAIACYLPVGAKFADWFSSPFAALGRISYSMYLIHFPIMIWLNGLANLWRPFTNGYHSAFMDTLFILLPLTLGASALTYLAVEKPFLAMRHRYVETREFDRRKTSG